MSYALGEMYYMTVYAREQRRKHHKQGRSQESASKGPVLFILPREPSHSIQGTESPIKENRKEEEDTCVIA
jgi:hypothetical protein